MAMTAVVQPPPMEVGPTSNTVMPEVVKPTYANTIKPSQSLCKPIPLKQMSYLHGEPHTIWEKEEVNQMIINEDL